MKSIYVNRLSMLLWLALCASMATILYQRHQLSQISIINHSYERVKRSASSGDVDETIEYSVSTRPSRPPPPPIRDVLDSHEEDHPMYFPLYTRLSSKALDRICQEKFQGVLSHFSGGGDTMVPLNGAKEGEEENRTKAKVKANTGPISIPTSSTRHRSKHGGGGRAFKDKVCAPVNAMTEKQLMTTRLNSQGSALRHGDRWLLAEYAQGNMIFEYDTASPSNESDTQQQQQFDFPSAVHTLIEPFRGTDHTIGAAGQHHQHPQELIFYYEIAAAAPIDPHVRIQALHLLSGRRITRLLSASKKPLYGGGGAVSSAVDLEADQTALWALYRSPKEDHLSVSKMSLHSLKELARFSLTKVDPAKLINAFVSCGVLHTVVMMEENSTVNVSAVFDLRADHYLNREIGGAEWKTASGGGISNVQYDHISDSLSVFDSGSVYSISLIRKNPLD